MKVTIPQDTEWQAKRQQRWDDVLEYAGRAHGISKAEKKKEDLIIAAKKQWYLQGELTPLLEEYDKLPSNEEPELFDVLDYAPIVDVDEYVEFFKAFSMWLSEQKFGFWSSSKNRDAHMVDRLLSFYMQPHTDSTEVIYAYMFELLIPDDEGIVALPFPLGNDNWRPSHAIALFDYSFDLLNNLRKYLFSRKDDAKGYSHLKHFVDQVKYIKELDTAIFSTTYLEGKTPPLLPLPAPRSVSKASQSIMRGILGNLLGYKNKYDKYEGPLHHADLEVEKKLKTFIDSLPMPEEYQKLVEFIHAHPDDYHRRSE